jgi:hypothetical protein
MSDRGIAALLLALLGSSVAAADNPDNRDNTHSADKDSAQLQSFINDDRVKHSLEGVAARSTVMMQSKCEDARYTVDSKFEIVQPPTFDASGNPVSGSWKQVINEKGCDDSRVLNVLVQVKPGGGLAAASLLPGTTHLDPLAQKEAIDKAVSVANEVPHSGDPNCRSGYVADTKFLEAAGDSWKETWTLVSCQRKYLMPMEFTLGNKGAHIFAGPVGHVKLIPLGDNPQVVGEFMEPTKGGH